MTRFFDQIAQLARRVACFLAAQHRRAVAYRDLQLLDDRMLRDIGLSHRAAALVVAVHRRRHE
jgi:uncharacterized protein YjiS (DUF1127 family)